MEDNSNSNENPIENNQEGLNNHPRILPGLDKKRKIAIVILLSFSFLMLLTWPFSLKHKIDDPFIYKGEDSDKVVEEDLNLKDTDGDGLSDSDEINIYGTSPYLEDSDSDGFSDYEEVSSGNNPNCMAGGDYVEPEIDNPDAEGNFSSIIENNLEDISSFSDEDAEVLRNLFIDAGYDEETINGLSNDELYQSYLYMMTQDSEESPKADNNDSMTNDILGEVGSGGEVEEGLADANSIREAFVAAGYDEIFLEQISDEDLIKMYNSALNEYGSE